MADLCYNGATGFKRQKGDGYALQKEGALAGTLSYSGPKTDVDSFLSSWPNGRGHPENPFLLKIGHQIQYRGPMAVVTMQFEGIDPTEAGGVSGEGAKRKTERVKRRALVTKSGVDYFVDYWAPMVTVTWQSGAEPAAPRKEGTSGVSSLDVELDIATPRAASDAAPTGEPASFFTKGTDYDTIPLCVTFTIEPSGDDYLITELWTQAVYNKA